MQNLNSTSTTTSEKIRTGQSFLYRKNGTESQVLEFVLTDTIDGNLLTTAAEQTFKRYPYFTQKFVVINDDYFLVDNDATIVVRHSADHLPLGGSATNEHLIDIHYFGATLFIAYHHGMTDGRGMMPFVRTLLFYYLSKKYQVLKKVPDLRLSTTPFLPGEQTEPGLVALPKVANTSLPQVRKAGYILPEAANLSMRPTSSSLDKIQIDHDSLMAFAKNIGATPAIAISLLFSKAIDELRDSLEPPVNCNIVTDLRAGLHLENTYRNCVSSAEFNFDRDLPLATAAKSYRAKLTAFKTPANLQAEFLKIRGLSDVLDTLPNFAAKQEALSFFDLLRTDTYTLSYIGQLNLGTYENYLAEMHTYMSGTPGLSIEMLALNDNFFIDVIQSFANTRYCDRFLALLTAHHITACRLTTTMVSTPRDELNV